ncbi:MAG: sulfide/dihydroorotate dehydrogenase-like FAD/NAD-binding protein [Lentisphaerota bacterium]
MNTILNKRQLSENVYLMEIISPLIAKECKAGQFIILSLDNDFAERIPLTIADSDSEKDTITIIFQVVGKTTFELAKLSIGEKIVNLLGPLGKPTHVEKFGKVICIGGGIGVAPSHPIAKAMKKAGNELKVIIGARSKDLIIFESEMRKLADELIICTDDGSYGRKAIVTEPLKELCISWKPDMVVAIGPGIMMKFCAETTRPFAIPTLVSLNTIMIDGTGMCGGCRVTVGGETKFVCCDGPEFDGHKVDFDNMMSRLQAYKEIETNAYHKCKLDSSVQRGKL